MANTDFIQATIEIFGAVILVVVAIIFVIITSNEKKSEKTLFSLLIGAAFSLLFDAGWYIFDGSTTSTGVWLNWFCNLAIFMCNPILALLLNRYICNVIRETGSTPNRLLKSVVKILAVISFIMPVTNQFRSWMYYFDEQNIYHRLIGWYGYTVINSLSILMCSILVVVHRNSISVKLRRAIYLFVFAPFIGIAIQSTSIGISFIQIGMAVSCLIIIFTYLIEWMNGKRNDSSVSADTKKIWLIECVFSIMILFVSTAIISCAVSIKSVTNKSSQENSIALAYMVGGAVESTLSEPINVSKTMAQSDIIIDALSMENLEGTENEAEMIRFMNRVRDEYGYQRVFVASDKNKTYYTDEGFSRFLDMDLGKGDAWYNEYINRNVEYELNIDADKDDGMRLAVFVNMEIVDDDGQFIGVCGVAMSLETLMEMLAQFENRYDIDIALTDNNGLVQLDTNRGRIERDYCDISEIESSNPDEVSYSRSKSKAVLGKNMEKLGWYLIIEDNKPDKLDVFKIILPSMIIYVLGVIIMMAFSLAIGSHERNRSKELRVTKLQSESAQAASDAKGRFLANMSHEIRTPINAVLGMDTMILRESKEAQIREYAMNIQTAGKTLLSLINDILDFSKIESGKLEIIPVEYDFATLINDVYNMIQVKAAQKSLEVSIDIDSNLPGELYGDDVRLRQILVNLMTNAVKYTENGCVSLKVEGSREDDDIVLHFSVKDTGIGIRPEDMEKLFLSFERIEEKRNRDIEGTGLGMSITIELLSLMNSKLDVKSNYGQGSEFLFDIRQRIINDKPIGDFEARIYENAKNYEYYASFTAPNARILVVDDNEVNRVVFRGLLKETQMHIDEAKSGTEALECILKTPYDVVFLDHMMDDMDGIQVLHRVKSSSNHPNTETPFIILTANAISGAKEMFIREGFDAYLSKPIVSDNLETMLRRFISSDKLILASKSIGTVDEKADNELPIIEGVDWNYALLHFPKCEMLITAIKSFCDALNKNGDELSELYGRIREDSMDREALDKYRVRIHAMKSNANMIGAFSLAGQALALEVAAREGRVEQIIDTTPYFLDSWYNLKESLLTVTGGNLSERKEIKSKENIEEIEEAAKLLIEAMDKFDVHEADDAMAIIEEYEYYDDFDVLMDELRGAVGDLDVDSVKELATDLVCKVKDNYKFG